MKKSVFTFIVYLIPLLLIGCSGQADADQNIVNITLEGMDTLTFDQKTLTAPAGATINLTLKNMGSLEHNFLITDEGADLITMSEEIAFRGSSTGNVLGGEEQTITFTAPAAPGNYVFVCIVPGHAASGMSGKFTITE